MATEFCVINPIICLVHYATSRKIVALIPDYVIDFSGHIMAMEFTQPLKEMSTRKYFWEQSAAGA
jgi:hypothetical protein